MKEKHNIVIFESEGEKEYWSEQSIPRIVEEQREDSLDTKLSESVNAYRQCERLEDGGRNMDTLKQQLINDMFEILEEKMDAEDKKSLKTLRKSLESLKD